MGYLTVLRQWWWTSIFAALMGLFCLAGIGLVYLIWRHTGCMYGLFVLGAVEVLGTSAIVAGLWGLVAAALARRRPGTTSPAGWTANLAILLVALLIVVPTMAQLSRAWGPR